MNILVIYDSNFGNTKTVAEIIAQTLGSSAQVKAVGECEKQDLADINLLIVGSPINGWRPTSKIGTFLAQLQRDQLQGCKVAAFDTRIKVWFAGDAAKKIARNLEKAGAKLIAPPQAFYVKDREGPLVEGETEKAVAWAKSLASHVAPAI